MGQTLDRFDHARPEGGDSGVLAGFLVKWLIDRDLLAPLSSPRAASAELLASVRADRLTGREFVVRAMDERPQREDLSEEGYRFWRHLYGKPKWFAFQTSRFERVLMRRLGVNKSALYRLSEGDAATRSAVLEQISDEYAAWA